jgi:hypothetical protein
MANPARAEGFALGRRVKQKLFAGGVENYVITPQRRGKRSRFTGEAPLSGYIPTGVVFTITSASEWSEMLSN